MLSDADTETTDTETADTETPDTQTADTRTADTAETKSAQPPADSVAGHVTAVLLVYNNAAGACRVLDAVKAQRVRPGKIIVVDNGSQDGSAAQIAATHPDVTLIARRENGGVGVGHNTGWRAAMADPHCAYIWTLEHDTLPEPDCLATLLAAHRHYYPAVEQVEQDAHNDSHSEDREEPLGVVFPTMVLPYDTDARLHLALRFFTFRRLTQPSPDDEPSLRPGCTFNGTLYPVAVIRRVGLLIEEFFFSSEDSDFNLRCLAAGVELRMVPAARIHHNIYRLSRMFDLGWVVILLPGRAGTFRIYYGLRNNVALMRRKRPGWRTWLRYGAGYLLAQINDLIFGPNRLDRLRARTAALRDGLQGRMGRATYKFLHRTNTYRAN